MKKIVCALVVASLSLTAASGAFAAAPGQTVAQLAAELQESNRQINLVEKQIAKARSLRGSELTIGIPLAVGGVAVGLIATFMGAVEDDIGGGSANATAGEVLATGGVLAGGGTAYLVHVDNKNIAALNAALEEAKKRNAVSLAALNALSR